MRGALQFDEDYLKPCFLPRVWNLFPFWHPEWSRTTLFCDLEPDLRRSASRQSACRRPSHNQSTAETIHTRLVALFDSCEMSNCEQSWNCKSH